MGSWLNSISTSALLVECFPSSASLLGWHSSSSTFSFPHAQQMPWSPCLGCVCGPHLHLLSVGAGWHPLTRGAALPCGLAGPAGYAPRAELCLCGPHLRRPLPRPPSRAWIQVRATGPVLCLDMLAGVRTCVLLFWWLLPSCLLFGGLCLL